MKGISCRMRLGGCYPVASRKSGISTWGKVSLRGCYGLTCIALALVSGLLIYPEALAQGPAIEAWVARYNGPANSIDMAYAVAVDGQGNIYVTGYSLGVSPFVSDDYATIKYDTNGSQLWVARYNGPGNGWDEARAMAVDGQGNVYVTGYSWGGGPVAEDYATIKYNSNGSQLWVARYNAPGNSTDMPKAIAVDSQGNVYVTGFSWGWDTYWDYATVKYATNGSQLWVARYTTPGNGWDEAMAIAVDGQGNVYVTGKSWDPFTGHDYATIKYDTNGNQVWVRRYNGPGNGYDVAGAVAVDGQGNVYVTGTSTGSGTNDDYATVKYDTNGSQLWVARYNGPGNGWDEAMAIAVDGQGNVYVTGDSVADYATIKYVQGVSRTPSTDFDGDDRADMAVWRSSNGGWFVWGSSFGPYFAGYWGSEALGDIPVPGDYDGDGRADVAVWRASDGYWFISKSSGGYEIYPWGSSALGDIPVPADYDGDGKMDPAVWRASNGGWFVMGSTSGPYFAGYWGSSALGDVPVPRDYDGDGRDDVAVWRASDGYWFILKSTGGYDIHRGFSSALGDIPVPADYDGDGKVDPAVWRPGDGGWYVLGSTEGPYVAAWWGTNGDIPVPGHYDSDSQADPAVWRPSDGYWYIYQTTGGYGVYQWGNESLGDVPLREK